MLLGKFLLATALAGFRCNSATVEVVVCDENGLAVFGGRAARVTGGVFLYAFDLLKVDGTDLRCERIFVVNDPGVWFRMPRARARSWAMYAGGWLLP